MINQIILQAILKLGSAGPNSPIYGGALVFALTGLTLFYLSFVSDEFEAGVVLRFMSIALLAFALLAIVWPSRPWPH